MSYINDPESPGEVARLIKQAGLLDACTAVVPRQLFDRQFHSLLDIGCGPGNWALEAASHFPDADVIGMDISTAMIRYAQTRADVLNCQNVGFEVRDALDERSFPLEEEDYDLIHLALASSWLPTCETWQILLHHYYGMLDPGGALVVTEAELALTTSPALNRLQTLILSAFQASGRSSGQARSLGTVTHLGRTLRSAGFGSVKIEVNAFDFSYSNPMENMAWRDTIPILIHEISPFLIKEGVTTDEELEAVQQRIQIEMSQEDFCGIVPLWTFIAIKEKSADG